MERRKGFTATSAHRHPRTDQRDHESKGRINTRQRWEGEAPADPCSSERARLLPSAVQRESETPAELCPSRVSALPQKAGARLKVLATAAVNVISRFGLLGFKVSQIGRAEPAANGVDMEADVIRLLVRKDAKQVTTKLLTRGAAQPLTPPNLAQRVNSRIAPAIDLRQPLRQLRLRTQRALDCRHLLNGQRLVEVSFQFGRAEGKGHSL